MYQNCIDILKQIVGNEYLYLSEPIKIIDTDLFFIEVWALCASPAGDLYVMNGAEQWHQVEPTDLMAIEPVHKRLTAIAKKYVGALVSPSLIDNVLIAEAI